MEGGDCPMSAAGPSRHSRRRSNSVAFGAKRTSASGFAEPDYEYTTQALEFGGLTAFVCSGIPEYPPHSSAHTGKPGTTVHGLGALTVRAGVGGRLSGIRHKA